MVTISHIIEMMQKKSQRFIFELAVQFFGKVDGLSRFSCFPKKIVRGKIKCRGGNGVSGWACLVIY